MQTSAIDDSFVAMLKTRTGRPVGYAEAPSGAWKHPAVIVYPMAGQQFTGSLGSPHEMGDLVYQLTITGETAVQAAKGCDRAVAAVEAHWPEVLNCCGLVSVAPQGIVRIEDRLYQAVVSVTLKESAV